MTRHADVVEISRHPEIYCSGQGAVSILDLPPEMVEYFAGMISTDNPRHARLRRIVSAAFNPRRIKSIEDTIEEVADRVIERAAGLGECDFATEIAAPFPLEIICDMMGVPPSEYATVLRCSNVILSGGDPEYVPEGADPVLAFIDAGQELTELMNELSAQRIDHPADDLTTALITTNIDGEALTPGELASFFILLLTAGNETTRNAITHGLWALTEHPDQRALWQADPDTVGATGVDEIVRWAIAGHLDAPHRHRGHRALGPGAAPRGQGAPLLQLGQPGRVGVRGPVPVRRPPAPQSPPRVRGGRAPLLPGGPPGPPGDRRHDARAAAAPARHRGQRASPTGCTPASSTGSSTSPAGSRRPETAPDRVPIRPHGTGPQGLATITTVATTSTTNSTAGGGQPPGGTRYRRSGDRPDGRPPPPGGCRSAGHSASSAADRHHRPQQRARSPTQPSENDQSPWLMAISATPRTGTRNRIRPAQLTPGR